jgi:hypothetical protein
VAVTKYVVWKGKNVATRVWATAAFLLPERDRWLESERKK